MGNDEKTNRWPLSTHNAACYTFLAMRTASRLPVLVFVIVFLLPALSHADSGDSTEGFVPPAEKERPIAAVVDLSVGRTAGIVTGATGTAAGLALSAMGIYRVFGSVDRGFDSPQLQQGLLLGGTGVIVSALWTLLLEWHLDPPPPDGRAVPE